MIMYGALLIFVGLMIVGNAIEQAIQSNTAAINNLNKSFREAHELEKGDRSDRP